MNVGPDELTYQELAAFVTTAIERSAQSRRDLVDAELGARDHDIAAIKERFASEIRTVLERIASVERVGEAQQKTATSAIRERLDAMDKAQVILAGDIAKVPTDLQVAVATLKELDGVKFTSIKDQFEMMDRQTAREKAAADLALAAAFDAQKEAAAATNNANDQAIRKSELATAETIKTNADAQRAGQSSLSDKIEDVKDRMNRIESLVLTIQAERATITTGRTETRNMTNIMLVAVGVLVAMIALGVTIYSQKP